MKQNYCPLYIYGYMERERERGGFCGVMFTVVENGHDDPSSNPRLGYLHFHILKKDIDPTALPPAMDKF